MIPNPARSSLQDDDTPYLLVFQNGQRCIVQGSLASHLVPAAYAERLYTRGRSPWGLALAVQTRFARPEDWGGHAVC